MTDTIGDPIPNVFRPDDPAARFVVSMSMARNDIDRAFHDLIRSEKEDRQDFHLPRSASHRASSGSP